MGSAAEGGDRTSGQGRSRNQWRRPSPRRAV